MFGFSLPKLLFTFLAIFLVWYGFKWWTRQQELRSSHDKTGIGRGNAAAGSGKARKAVEAEDMIACSACGSYVVSRGAKSCGRGDCPYPG